MINDAGRQIIKDAEGLSLEAYRCPAGKLTIGWGHTGDVKEGDQITEHQAEVILDLDIYNASRIVDAAVQVDLNPNQYAAIVSFVFNVGPGKVGERSGFCVKKDGGPSTVLRMINGKLFRAAAEQFLRWTKVDGVELPGLVKRRAAERALWLQVVA